MSDRRFTTDLRWDTGIDLGRPRHGFSLVELVICILIIGILVAVAAPRFYSMADQARINQTVSEARKLNQLIAVSKQVSGNWPVTHAPGEVPPELVTIFPSLKFPNPPVPGTWTWLGPSVGNFGMSILVPPGKHEQNEYAIVDREFDDGIEDTGWITRSESRGETYWVFNAQ
ncbi:MAG: type II secretion system protein [Planctomycetaceae bacterium]|nr:type II secretion system protein [Planctomycetaceae bacterium]